MDWTFVVSTAGGVNIGEITNPYERKVVMPLGRPRAASVKVRWDDPLLLRLWDDDLLLKVYQGDTLRFHGQMIGNEAVADEQGQRSMAITAAGPMWRLTHRLAGKALGGTPFTATDRGAVAKAIVDTCNTEAETGVATQTITTGSTVTYTVGPYKNAMNEFKVMAEALDGFDWYESPIEYASGKLATLVGSPIIGQQRPDAVFEYGVGRSNARELKRTKSWETVATRAYHIADEGAIITTPNPIAVYGPTAAGLAAQGLHETLVDAPGIDSVSIRNDLVTEHVRVRENPRLVYTFATDFEDRDRPGRVPVFGTDYDLGDSVPLRTAYGGIVLFEGWVRVYSVTVEVDENGKVKVSPSTVPDEDAA